MHSQAHRLRCNTFFIHSHLSRWIWLPIQIPSTELKNRWCARATWADAVFCVSNVNSLTNGKSTNVDNFYRATQWIRVYVICDGFACELWKLCRVCARFFGCHSVVFADFVVVVIYLQCTLPLSCLTTPTNATENILTTNVRVILVVHETNRYLLETNSYQCKMRIKVYWTEQR